MNCKPGDIAIAINALNPENVGLIVEVVSRYPSAAIEAWFGHCWIVRSARPVPCGTARISRTDGMSPDAWLRPVSGLPLDIEETTTEPEAA